MSEIKSKTNADVIREMNIEQLAAFIEKVELGDLDYSVTFCNYCKGENNALHLDCNGCLKHWLNSLANDINGLFKLNSFCWFTNNEEDINSDVIK